MFDNRQTERTALGRKANAAGGRHAWRKGRIQAHLRARGVDASVKYIDPSYTIRSAPADARDAAFCLSLGHNAVHAGMAGRTEMVIGYWKHEFTHVPIALAVSERKRIDPNGRLWNQVLAATGQPRTM